MLPLQPEGPTVANPSRRRRYAQQQPDFQQMNQSQQEEHLSLLWQILALFGQAKPRKAAQQHGRPARRHRLRD